MHVFKDGIWREIGWKKRVYEKKKHLISTKEALNLGHLWQLWHHKRDAAPEVKHPTPKKVRLKGLQGEITHDFDSNTA